MYEMENKMKYRASVADWIKQKKESLKTDNLELSSQRKTKKKEWKEVKKAYLNYTVLLREQSIHH